MSFALRPTLSVMGAATMHDQNGCLVFNLGAVLKHKINAIFIFQGLSMEVTFGSHLLLCINDSIVGVR